MTDLKAMTDEQLEQHVQHLYGQWMYHEAAERGYDYRAAAEAKSEYLAACGEQTLRQCRTQSEPFLQAIEVLVTGSKA